MSADIDSPNSSNPDSSSGSTEPKLDGEEGSSFAELFSCEIGPNGQPRSDYTDLRLPDEQVTEELNVEPDPVQQLSASAPPSADRSSATLSINGRPMYVLPSGNITITE